MLKSIYNTNDTMRLIGHQTTEYLYYNNGLDKMKDIEKAHKDKKMIYLKNIYFDIYLIAFIQGMRYERERKTKQQIKGCN